MKLTLKTREEIAFELGISSQTLRRWLKKEQIELKNRLISVDDQVMIYRRLGMSPIADRILSAKSS